MGLLDPKDDSKPHGPLNEFRVVPVEKPKDQGQVEITVSQGLSDATGRWTLARDRIFSFWSMERIQLGGLRTFSPFRD